MLQDRIHDILTISVEMEFLETHFFIKISSSIRSTFHPKIVQIEPGCHLQISMYSGDITFGQHKYNMS